MTYVGQTCHTIDDHIKEHEGALENSMNSEDGVPSPVYNSLISSYKCTLDISHCSVVFFLVTISYPCTKLQLLCCCALYLLVIHQ